MQLEGQFGGPLRDTLIQRWRGSSRRNDLLPLFAHSGYSLGAHRLRVRGVWCQHDRFDQLRFERGFAGSEKFALRSNAASLACASIAAGTSGLAAAIDVELASRINLER
jgi:hypothetical protein